MVYVRFLGCGRSERVVQRRNSPYLDIHSSEGALHKSKNSLALDDLRFSKKWHHGTELYTDVVYHFIYWHGKTCWFTIWENGQQIKNSGPVIFFPGNAFTMIGTKSVPACTQKRREVLKLRYHKWLWGNGIRIFVWNIPSWNLKLWLYIFSYSVAPGSFPQVLTQKSCSVYFPTRFLGNIL